MLESAIEQTNLTKIYDPNYVVLSYPNGDVPIEKGVCTDVVIRAFRKAGVDLQKEVHEDMAANFSVYPKKWSLKSPDANIDHRRVPNLQTFFTRKGKSLPVTENGADYKIGDVVAWDLDGSGTNPRARDALENHEAARDTKRTSRERQRCHPFSISHLQFLSLRRELFESFESVFVKAPFVGNSVFKQNAPVRSDFPKRNFPFIEQIN